VFDADDVVIALMGVTGAGKSSFISRVTGRDDIKIGYTLTSGM
jgi:putative ribosome biogenesis GTPase RsgA